MKVRFLLVAVLILVLIGVVGLGESQTYNENIGDAESVVLSGSLDFDLTTVNTPSHSGVVMCDDVLVIDVYFNHDVTLFLEATAFVGSSKTLPTEYGFVAVGLEETAPTWFGFDSQPLGAATIGVEFTDWNHVDLYWDDPNASGTIIPFTWPLSRALYPSGRKYMNAKVRVTRDGYADPAGTYTATITVTFI